MKKYFAIAVFVITGLAVNAQTNESTDHANSDTKIEERVEKMKTELSLTTDQESKLREAMKLQMEEMRVEKKKMREAEKSMKAINKKYHESLSGFLSEEQLVQVKGMKPSSEDREGREQNKGSKKSQK